MTYAAANEFRVGAVLSRGFAILISNIVPFGAICLILSLPNYLYWLAAPDPAGAQSASGAFGAIAIAGASLLLAQVAAAALVYGTIQELRGRHAGVGECISRGLSLMFPILGVAIVSSIGIGIGLILLIVPGIILAVMWWVAIPSAVVERPGVFAALGRSAELTKGYRWRILGLLIFVVLFLILIGVVVSLVVGLIGSVAIGLFIQWLVNAFATALYAVVAAVGYHDLRVAKEGFDVNQVAAVFD